MKERRSRVESELREQDELRIKMIQAFYPVSRADVVRMGLVAICRQLGLEKDPDDALQKY